MLENNTRNFLFICTLNKWRSLTAEHIFKNVSGLSVQSAGTASNARHSVNSKDLEWAEVVFVMEKKHQEHLEEKFGELIKSKKVVNLNIEDEYEYMDEELVEILKREVEVYL